jgi:3-hydroxyisobutyrate dehydrogenase-like beta-hydroxyacid dehydrogenase
MKNAGYIGVGDMGGQAARRIMESGFRLSVYDIRRKAAEPLLRDGAQWGESPEEMARHCEIVFTCLPGPNEVETVVYGRKGLRRGWKNGDTYVDMTTSSPELMRRIARDAAGIGVGVIDAPVSRLTGDAPTDTWTIMVGSEPAVFNKARRALESISPRVFHVGPVGCGQMTKLVNNMIAFGCRTVTAEGFVLGVKAGIDPQTLWEVLKAGSANTPFLQRYPKEVFSGVFDTAGGFKLQNGAKDTGLAVQEARELGLRLPVAEATAQLFKDAMASGFGDKTSAGIILELEKKAGIQVRTNQAKGQKGHAG